MVSGHLGGGSRRQNAHKLGAVNKYIAVRGCSSLMGESSKGDSEGIAAGGSAHNGECTSVANPKF